MKVTIEGQRGLLYEGHYTRQETANLVTLTLSTNYHTVTVRTIHGKTVIGITDDVDQKIKHLFHTVRIEGEKLPGDWETVFEGTFNTATTARKVHKALKSYDTVRVDDRVFDRSYDVDGIHRVLSYGGHTLKPVVAVTGIVLTAVLGGWIAATLLGGLLS